MARRNVIVKDRGLNTIRRQGLQTGRDAHAAVGVLADLGAKRDPNDAITLIEKAVWNHFGTDNIPARPFIADAVQRHRGEILDLSKRLLRLVFQNKVTVRQALDIIGVKIVGFIVDDIDGRSYAPNAAVTVDRKGSSTPLVDTGQLKGSVTNETRNV